MVLDGLWAYLEREVFVFPSTSCLFNQYRASRGTFDKADAHLLRRANLRYYLESFQARPRFMLVGEAPGWRGCRFSGVPFTSEAQLCQGLLPFRGQQTSNRTPAYDENTAVRFWHRMRDRHSLFFAWNSVPFHPHRAEAQDTNRKPSSKEKKETAYLLRGVYERLEPSCVVAVGRQAEKSFQDLGIPVTYVTHPARGHHKQFEKEILAVLSAQNQEH
jgi:uracil-DNA glycosylase